MSGRSGIMASVTIGRSAGLAGAVVQHRHSAQPFGTAFPHDHSALGVHGGAMRLIHTSDWHLGRTLHGENLLPYQERFLCWLLGEAVRHQAGAVVVAGDIYDRAVPPLDAVRLLDAALLRFAQARIPVILTSGNHDSAVRLGFGAGLSESAGIHLRTSVADLARPVLLADEHGPVAVYGVPYLLPDAVMADLGVESRTHEAVLAEAARRIRADAAARGIGRTVVAAHAFVTGGQPAESERDIRIGGVADVPAGVFAGFSYVALGHLHGAQRAGPPGAAAGSGPVAPGTVTDGPVTDGPVTNGTVIRYSGSPLAFSFSEKDHRKSVTLAEIDAAGQVHITALPTPVPRPLREVRGTLDGLLARADQHRAGELPADQHRAGEHRLASTGPASTGPASTGPASTGPASTGPASTGPASSGRNQIWRTWPAPGSR